MKQYGLLLNNMQEAKIENLTVVKVSTDRDELVRFYNERLVEPYKDGKWNKTFRQGSELEWYNPVVSLNVDNDYWGGIWTREMPDE